MWLIGLSISTSADTHAIGVNMRLPRLEPDAGPAFRRHEAIGCHGSHGQTAEFDARDALAAKIIDAPEADWQAVPFRQIDEFGPDPEFELLSRRRMAIEQDGTSCGPSIALLPSSLQGSTFMPGEPMKMPDKSVGRPVEQFAGRSHLHHGAVMHHHDRIGEGQRLGLVVGDIDHADIELLVQLLQLRSQLPFEMRIDHGQRLVEQDRRDIRPHQPPTKRYLLLRIRRQSTRTPVETA